MSILITTLAAEHLQKLIKETDLNDPVVTIVKSESSQGHDLGWNVAFIERANLTDVALETLGNLVVFIDEQWQSELDNYKLDVRAGQFIVVPHMKAN
jgi:Fe-S cluster assembly iron-binding protein IscA